MCANDSTARPTDRRGFLATAAGASLAALAGMPAANADTYTPRVPDPDDEIYPPGLCPQPEGVYALCYGGNTGIVLIDGILCAFSLEGSDTAEDWQVQRRFILIPAGVYESESDLAGIKVHFIGERWECELCRTDQGMLRSTNCKHCRAAAYVYFHLFYSHG